MHYLSTKQWRVSVLKDVLPTFQVKKCEGFARATESLLLWPCVLLMLSTKRFGSAVNFVSNAR
jgi:hypothetical protein